MIQLKCVFFDANNQQAIKAIRQVVFTEEQGVSPDIEFDGKDSTALHVLAFNDGKAVATGRMLSDGHIGRIAVLKAFRNKGIGSKVIKALVNQASQLGYTRVCLNAQSQAVSFYQLLGFQVVGEAFIEADIVHLPMERLF